MPPYLTRIAPRWSLTHFVGVCALAFFALGRFIRNVATRWRLYGSGAALTVAALVLVACGHESKPLSPSERIRAESVEVTTLPNGAQFYLSDAQESPLAVVSASGAVRSRAAYHAYGQARHQVGVAGDAFGYLRNEEDRGSGLSDFGARPYRPELGAFLAPDPVGLFEPEKVIGKPTVGQGYAYASGDPINTIDRDGRCGTPYAVTGMGCEKNYGPQLPEAAQKAVDEGATHAPEHVFTFLAIVDGVGVVAAGARFLAVAVTRKLLGVALKEGAETIAETAVSMAAKGGVESAAKEALRFGADDLVLGLNRGGSLKQWTAEHGGRTFGEFNLPRGSFDAQIRSAMDQSKSIRFNLDGVDVGRASGALNEFGEPIAGYTNYELHLLKTNAQYLEKATFFQNGAQVSSPF